MAYNEITIKACCWPGLDRQLLGILVGEEGMREQGAWSWASTELSAVSPLQDLGCVTQARLAHDSGNWCFFI